jgi:hypothetical protein
LLAALFLSRRPLRHPDLAIPLSLLTMTGAGLLIAVSRTSLLTAAGFALFGTGAGCSYQPFSLSARVTRLQP